MKTQNKSVVATADNAASSLRSGRLDPAAPHFKRSTMKSKGYTRWVTAALFFAAFAAWALLAARLIMNQGDSMIGFHPVILAIFPGVIVGSISAIILLVCRQWQTGIALGLGALTLFLVLRNGHAIEQEAWRSAIELHAQVNETAMTSIQADFQGDNFSDLWEEEKLSSLEGFQWYGTNHFSAPNGVYFGFRVGSVPHVRIQKIRHGWRGIALVHSEQDLAALSTRSGMTYSRIESSDWCTWITD